MSTIKQMIRLHMDGMKNREIARKLGIYKGTVNKYVARAEADTMPMEELLSLDDPVLERRLSSGKLAAPDGRFEELRKRLDHIVEELSRPKSHLTLYQLEKPRSFDPRGQAKLTPEGKIRLTLSSKIKLTPEKQLLFRGFFVVLSIVLADG